MEWVDLVGASVDVVVVIVAEIGGGGDSVVVVLEDFVGIKASP